MTREESPDRPGEIEALFRSERQRLFGLAYRLTGSAEDADDVVQDAFMRLATRAPDVPIEGLGPWLARVTTNLGIDALRRRKRRAYVGPWLPSPIAIPEPDPLEGWASHAADPEASYGLAESTTFAFLVALEALSPRQRAVLLLRDVLGRSAQETADFLGCTQGGVRIAHLRARRSLAAYDANRCIPTAALRERHRLALEGFLDCLTRQDVQGIEALLAESVRTVTDAAGEFTALATPLEGRTRVARFYQMASLHRQAGGVRTEIHLLNGLPAAMITLLGPVRRQAPRSLLRCELDEAGHIVLIHAVLAPRKLAALPSA